MSSAEIMNILRELTDPEIPVLTLEDLGIIRKVTAVDDKSVEVIITPTYTGCPAMDLIAVQIKAVLQDNGFEHVEVRTELSPPWTTDWLSEEGKKKLKEYGIAPPKGPVGKGALLGINVNVACPRCGSEKTRLVSEFGSTACKALYQCKECLEPFDYFKCI